MAASSPDLFRYADGIIAIGNYDFRASGTVAKSMEIAAAAADAGLPVQLWVVRDEGALRDRVPDGAQVVVTGTALRGRSRGLDLALNIPGLAAALHRRRPALFLSGGNHLHLAAYAAMLMSGRRKHMLFGARASNSARRGHPTAWRRLLSNNNNRLKYGGADFVVAVSHALADEVRAALPGKNLAVIPNGVDLAKVDRLAQEPFDHAFFHARRSNEPIIVSMGRLVRQKGFDVLLKAVARMPLRARLMIIGDGDPDQVTALEALAQKEGIADRVALLGYQRNPFAVLSRADLFVSASRWEGASNALIEALACGLPLAATDCPTGNREVVEAGPFGTLAPVDDVDKLADAITAELRLHRASSTQQAGARRWSLEKCLQLWVALLKEKSAASSS